MWEHCPGCTSEAKVAEAMYSGWIQEFSSEDVALEVDMVIQILYCICSIQFFAEIFSGIVNPLKILSLNFKGVGLMFINRSVLDLVKLIELTLKDHEITSRLRIQVDNIALELFNGINNFQEVLMSKEELEVFLINFFDDLFNRIKVSILIEELLQILMRVFLQPIYNIKQYLTIITSKKVYLRTQILLALLWRQPLEQEHPTS